MLRNTKRITGQVGWAGSERNMAPSLLCGQATIRVNSNIGGPRKKKEIRKKCRRRRVLGRVGQQGAMSFVL